MKRLAAALLTSTALVCAPAYAASLPVPVAADGPSATPPFPTPAPYHQSGFGIKSFGGAPGFAYQDPSNEPVRGVLAPRPVPVAPSVLGFVTPQMYGGKGDGTDDSVALQAWLNAGAALHLPARMPETVNGYCTSRTLNVTNQMDIEADDGANLNACGASTGMQFAPGNYGSMHLPGFGNFALAINMVGTDLARFKVPYIGSGTDQGVGVRMTTGAPGFLGDNIIEVGQVFNLDTAFAINCDSSTGVIQGNQLKWNFVTQTRKIASYQGTICSEDGNSFVGDAVDITPDKGGGYAIGNEALPAAMNPNANGSAVPRATFVVSEWFGGGGFTSAAVGGASQLIKGQFSQIKFDIRSTEQWTLANQVEDSEYNLIGADLKFNTGGGHALDSLIGYADTTSNLATASAAFTGSVSVTTANQATTAQMTVTAMTSGTLQVGQMIAGASVPADFYITSQVSGMTGGVGVYMIAYPGFKGATLTISSEALTAAPMFNGGQPQASDTFPIMLETPVDLGPGQTQDFFVWVMYPDAITLPWRVRQANGISALTLTGYIDEDAGTGAGAYAGNARGKMRIRLTNNTSTIVAHGERFRAIVSRSQD